eukprot:IDg15409t1
MSLGSVCPLSLSNGTRRPQLIAVFPSRPISVRANRGHLLLRFPSSAIGRDGRSPRRVTRALEKSVESVSTEAYLPLWCGRFASPTQNIIIQLPEQISCDISSSVLSNEPQNMKF